MDTTHSSSVSVEASAYAQLQREMHEALLAQHPEWILPNGDCPTCDSYDARFAELLTLSLATEREHEAPNTVQRRWPRSTPSVDNARKGSMLAGYAEPRNIVFAEMVSAIR